ncbi:unnamed protein product, partial [Prorocentrum cordatum]
MPYLRAFFLVSGDPVLRREVVSCLRLMPEFLKVLLLLATFVLLSAWLGAVLFTIDGPEGSYFTNFAVSLWSLMALLATNNFPDIMMKGYTTNRAYGIFFTAYLVLGLFLLLQMVIAVVYNSYIRQREADLKLQAARRQHLLAEAFGALDSSGRGWLESGDLDALLAALGEESGVHLRDEARRALVFAVLDADGSGRVEPGEFGGLVRVLGLRFEPERRPWLEASMPELWSRCGCDRLGEILGGRRLELAIDGILVASVCVTFVQTWPLLIGSEDQRLNEFTLDNVVDLAVTTVFLMELVLKIAILGWHTYWVSWKNRFDAVVTVAAVGALGYVVIPNGYNDYMLVRSVVLLRLFRLLRLLADVPAFATVLAAMAAVGPGARRVLPLLLCVMMAFAVLGCDIFGGCITNDPGISQASPLSGTSFGQNGYYALNFNDRPGGIVTLFACLVMNNWNVYVEGFAAASGPGAYAFFTVWWVVGNLLGLNLVTSVVLDAFVDRWGAMHSGEVPALELAGPHGVAFDAGVVSGTRTGLSGRWTVRAGPGPASGFAAAPGELRRMLEPSRVREPPREALQKGLAFERPRPSGKWCQPPLARSWHLPGGRRRTAGERRRAPHRGRLRQRTRP